MWSIVSPVVCIFYTVCVVAGVRCVPLLVPSLIMIVVITAVMLSSRVVLSLVVTLLVMMALSFGNSDHE